MSHEPFETGGELALTGGPIRWYAAGDPDTVPILLLHGAMLDTAQLSWHFLAPKLARNHRVYAIDLPRHGGSRPWTGVLDQSACERVLHDVLDHLGLDRVNLVGLSMGGGVSLGYALAHPERVARAILLAPGGLDARRAWQFTTWATIRTPGALHWTSWLLARSPRLVRSSLVSNLNAGEQAVDLERIVLLAQEEARARWTHREPALDDWQSTAYGPFRMRLNFQPRLGNLDVRTLWIRGEHDPLVGEPELALAAEASGGRFESVPNAGHLLPLDQPEVLHNLIEEFVSSTSG